MSFDRMIDALVGAGIESRRLRVIATGGNIDCLAYALDERTADYLGTVLVCAPYAQWGDPELQWGDVSVAAELSYFCVCHPNGGDFINIYVDDESVESLIAALEYAATLSLDRIERGPQECVWRDGALVPAS